MSLFATPPIDAAYDRLLDPPDVHEEDGCEGCHLVHRKSGELIDGCKRCADERCGRCLGRGHVGAGANEEECRTCEATGRIA